MLHGDRAVLSLGNLVGMRKNLEPVGCSTWFLAERKGQTPGFFGLECIAD
jgi:hypothetical protein